MQKKDLELKTLDLKIMFRMTKTFKATTTSISLTPKKLNFYTRKILGHLKIVLCGVSPGQKTAKMWMWPHSWRLPKKVQ